MPNPTWYDWLGGAPALLKLTTEFYRRVEQDPLLKPVFAGMDQDHPAHVADFIGEVFGGPKRYSQHHGGHSEMIRHHLNRHLSEPHRRQWIKVLLDTYTDSDLPQDPEFALALVAYLEWGSRLAVINSQPGAEVIVDAPMPRWDWGATGGPYVPDQAEG